MEHPRGYLKRNVKAVIIIKIKQFPESLFSVYYSESCGQEGGWVWGREREIEKEVFKFKEVIWTGRRVGGSRDETKPFPRVSLTWPWSPYLSALLCLHT